MQGPIHQAISLVIAGNAYLRGHDLADFWPDSSAFRFCRVSFVALGGKGAALSELPFADDVPSWFDQLRDTGTVGFNICSYPTNDPQISDRNSVGFIAGGPRWVIETSRLDESDSWESRWVLGDRNDLEKKIWNVTYVRLANDNASRLSMSPDPDALIGDLDSVLNDIQPIAELTQSSFFIEKFKKARSILNDHDSMPPADLKDVPGIDRLSPSAKRLLAATEEAWVFGGMGSWNDNLWFKGEQYEKYRQVSDRLFEVVVAACIAATNASCIAR